MKRHFSLLLVSLSAAAGCAAPASTDSGSFWASERGAELNESLDRAGSHVAKFEKQAEEQIQSEAE